MKLIKLFEEEFPEGSVGAFLEKVKNNKYMSITKFYNDQMKSFSVENSSIKSLEGSYDNLREFNCSHNQLGSLKGGPKIVSSYYNCSYNYLYSLEGCPDKVSTMTASHNQMRSLEGIGRTYLKECDNLYIQDNDFKSHLLGLFTIKGLKFFRYIPDSAFAREGKAEKALQIIQRNLQSEDRDILDCQEELINNDMKDFAKL